MARNDTPEKTKAGQKQKNARKPVAFRAAESQPEGPGTTEDTQASPKPAVGHDTGTRHNPLLIPCEDVDKLNEITVAYYDHIRPQNAAEASLVDLLIACIWRGARLVSYEAELLTNKAEDLQPTLAATYESISSARLFALAFEAIHGKGAASPIINNYLTSTRNAYHSALSDIERLRKIKGDPAGPYYPPKLAANVAPLPLDFPEPEPAPEPQPPASFESRSEATPGLPLEPHPQAESGKQPEQETSEVAPVPPSQTAPPKRAVKPDLKSLLARAVPNPNAPYSPNTIWVHLVGSDGKTILDNYERPVLWPVHIGPEEPATSTSPMAPPAAASEGGGLKTASSNPYNFSGSDVPDDLRTGN